MNSSDINSIINNLCDKLGTTANKLIPEMAGTYILCYDCVRKFNKWIGDWKNNDQDNTK